MNLIGNSASSEKDGQVLSDQNDGTNEDISSNWTKANDEANKVSSKRERF